MSDAVDILAIGAHPDDVEIACGGTVLNVTRAGGRVAIVDLTAGELGTNGTVDERRAEAARGAEALGVTERLQLGLRDGGLRDDDDARIALANVIRRFAPRILLAPSAVDDHPDHAAAGQLTIAANFLAGVGGFAPDTADRRGRAGAILFYMMHQSFTPDLIVDVTEHYDAKIASIECYASQLARPGAQPTNIASGDFLERIRARNRRYGDLIGAAYGEPFASHHPPGLVDVRSLRTR